MRRSLLAPSVPSTVAVFVWLISHNRAVFSLRTNQPSATSQQQFSLRTNQHQPSATSQPNRLSMAIWRAKTEGKQEILRLAFGSKENSDRR
jgi:hypothetical protein